MYWRWLPTNVVHASYSRKHPNDRDRGSCYELVLRPITSNSLNGSMAESPLRATVGSHDPAAWLEDHGDYLFAYAMLRVHNAAVAEDLVQDTLLAALQGVDAFRGLSR